MRGIWLAGAVLALAAGASPAAADDPVAVLRDSTLFGEWMPNCHAPRSLDNFLSVFDLDPEGQARTMYDGGGGRQITYSLRSGWQDGDRVMTEQITAKGESIEVVRIIEGDRMRVISSRNVTTGIDYVIDAVFTSDGDPTPFERRCG